MEPGTQLCLAQAQAFTKLEDPAGPLRRVFLLALHERTASSSSQRRPDPFVLPALIRDLQSVAQRLEARGKPWKTRRVNTPASRFSVLLLLGVSFPANSLNHPASVSAASAPH